MQIVVGKDTCNNMNLPGKFAPSIVEWVAEKMINEVGGIHFAHLWNFCTKNPKCFFVPMHIIVCTLGPKFILPEEGSEN